MLIITYQLTAVQVHFHPNPDRVLGYRPLIAPVSHYYPGPCSYLRTKMNYNCTNSSLCSSVQYQSNVPDNLTRKLKRKKSSCQSKNFHNYFCKTSDNTLKYFFSLFECEVFKSVKWLTADRQQDQQKSNIQSTTRTAERECMWQFHEFSTFQPLSCRHSDISA